MPTEGRAGQAAVFPTIMSLLEGALKVRRKRGVLMKECVTEMDDGWVGDQRVR